MNAPTTPGAEAPTTSTTPKLDVRARDAIDYIGLYLSQARAVALLMESDGGGEETENYAAGAIVTLMESAMAKLGEIEGGAA